MNGEAGEARYLNWDVAAVGSWHMVLQPLGRG